MTWVISRNISDKIQTVSTDFIFVGYNDVGYHNPDVITPNIDSLAKEGVTFEKSYVQPACTPSRSALMTGMYPFHIGRQVSVMDFVLNITHNSFAFAYQGDPSSLAIGSYWTDTG